MCVWGGGGAAGGQTQSQGLLARRDVHVGMRPPVYWCHGVIDANGCADCEHPQGMGTAQGGRHLWAGRAHLVGAPLFVGGRLQLVIVNRPKSADRWGAARARGSAQKRAAGATPLGWVGVHVRRQAQARTSGHCWTRQHAGSACSWAGRASSREGRTAAHMQRGAPTCQTPPARSRPKRCRRCRPSTAWWWARWRRRPGRPAATACPRCAARCRGGRQAGGSWRRVRKAAVGTQTSSRMPMAAAARLHPLRILLAPTNILHRCPATGIPRLPWAAGCFPCRLAQPGPTGSPALASRGACCRPWRA